MIKLEYPAPAFRIRTEQGNEQIFDPIRKRWIHLTDEEWVRQNIIQYLVQVLGFPTSLIAVEKEIKLGELNKRFDILVYDTNHQPWMLVECKAGHIEAGENAFHQMLRYHLVMPATYLVITNGSYTNAWKKENGTLVALSELPLWKREA